MLAFLEEGVRRGVHVFDGLSEVFDANPDCGPRCADYGNLFSLVTFSSLRHASNDSSDDSAWVCLGLADRFAATV